MTGKIFVIGDIHGNNKGLQQCLERSKFNLATDTLISLGDVADGWGETSECVDTLLEVTNLVAIRGNHDVWVYDWLKMGTTPILWTEQGGKATLDSYIQSGRFMDRDHQDFWTKAQQDWFIDAENRLFIHAGWHYRAGEFPRTARMSVNAGTIAKECHWDRSLLKGAKSGRINGFNATKQFKEVYIGHTATQSHLPENYGNLWNLDSGSGWDGKLTIMDVDTKEYWQSDFSKDLYPDEKGRD